MSQQVSVRPVFGQRQGSRCSPQAVTSAQAPLGSTSFAASAGLSLRSSRQIPGTPCLELTLSPSSPGMPVGVETRSAHEAPPLSVAFEGEGLEPRTAAAAPQLADAAW